MKKITKSSEGHCLVALPIFGALGLLGFIFLCSRCPLHTHSMLAVTQCYKNATRAFAIDFLAFACVEHIFFE